MIVVLSYWYMHVYDHNYKCDESVIDTVIFLQVALLRI